MPFIANTPESSVNRSDSKNPNTTCRGITSSGRPCRRAIASPSLTPGSARRPRTPDPRDESLYCWQHREQASLSAHSSPGPRATATPILEEGRTSLDTLADRLGLVDLQDKTKKKERKDRPSQYATGGIDAGKQSSRPPRPGKQKQKQKTKLTFCFCFSIPIEEAEQPPPPRPQPRPVQRPQQASSTGGGYKKSSNGRLSAAASPSKSSRKSTASHTARLKDLIPDTLDAATASALMAELARPYVDSEEAGYIYMFWLTPADRSTSSPSRPRTSRAPVDAARDLLAPPSPSPRSRRASDVVYSYADTNTRGNLGSGGAKKTMVLKIGRAANVQRRMNQWQRQCGRDVEVLRFYPYTSSMAAASTPEPARTTPHAHRVERLIHIELAGMGLKADRGTCDACGREHREWFEVDATRAGVREVDDVIRRWVEWDEESV